MLPADAEALGIRTRRHGGQGVHAEGVRTGWSAPQKGQRLKLVVQNRRFLLLTDKGQAPNLASQALGAALRVLREQWEQSFGYRPLLAETFTDPEAYAGTCFKASNWEPIGWSAGYSRHRADFYIANDRPKRLWVRPLVPEARQYLRAVEVPPECRPGLVPGSSGQLPLNQPQMDSLLDVFRQAPDPRDSNAQYRTGLGFGDDGDERFDWTRFYVLSLENKYQCKDGQWQAWGFANQGLCVRFVETGKDSRIGG